MINIDSIMAKAGFVMTYLLTLVSGQQYTLIPVDDAGSIMEQPEGSNIWIGQLFNGGKIEIPDSQVLMVEKDRYRVTVNNGQGYKSADVSDKTVERAIDNAPRNQETGEVELNSWVKIKDNKTGETIVGGDE